MQTYLMRASCRYASPADGGGDGIGEHRLHQHLNAVVAFDFNELGELCVVTRIAHDLLLATGARDIRAAEREGEAWLDCSRRRKERSALRRGREPEVLH